MPRAESVYKTLREKQQQHCCGAQTEDRESSIVPDSVFLANNEMCENLVTPVQYNCHLQRVFKSFQN